MNHSLRSILAGAALIAAQANAAAPTRFAAPEVASSIPSGSASGIGQVTFALLLVLAAVFVVALLMKRLRMAAGGASGIEVVAQASLGAKERAVIIRVGGERLLLGVASGQVTLLQTLPPEPTPGPGASPDMVHFQKPNFAALLKKSLGR